MYVCNNAPQQFTSFTPSHTLRVTDSNNTHLTQWFIQPSPADNSVKQTKPNINLLTHSVDHHFLYLLFLLFPFFLFFSFYFPFLKVFFWTFNTVPDCNTCSLSLSLFLFYFQHTPAIRHLLFISFCVVKLFGCLHFPLLDALPFFLFSLFCFKLLFFLLILLIFLKSDKTHTLTFIL